jgi:hypothetical protein
MMTGTLEHRDPATPSNADNVRTAAALDSHFPASVCEHGVLQPITATRADDGIEVRDGQRRTGAAPPARAACPPSRPTPSTAQHWDRRTDHHQIVTRAQVRPLGMVLATLEGRTPKNAWRNAASRFNPAPGASAEDVYGDTATGWR